MPRRTTPKDGEPKAVEAAPGVDVKTSDEPAPPRPDEGQRPEAAEEQPEPTLEEYEERRLAVVAALEEEMKTNGLPKSLPGKLAMITGLVGQIRKSGRNTFHNYSYAKESDLVEAIRPMLSRLRIWVWWSIATGIEGLPAHQRLSQTKRDRQGNITSESDTLTVVAAWFKFVDDEGGSTEPQLMMGYGDDTSDKGLYKAYTGMEKYFLFKTFLVSTGDDPEGDPRADRRAAAREASASPNVDVQSSRSSGTRQSQPTHGGRQTDASKPQVKQLGELIRSMNVRDSASAAALIGEVLGKEITLEGEDKSAALAKVMTDLKPGEIAKAIFELRKRQTAAADEPAGDPPADPAPEGDTTPDVPEVSAGTPGPDDASAELATTEEAV